MVLIPAMLLTLATRWQSYHSGSRFLIGVKELLKEPEWRVLSLFYLITTLSGLTGLNPLKSSIYSLRQFLLSLLIPIGVVIINEISIPPLLGALLLGQAVASLYSVFESSNLFSAPRLFLGAVTESGQLGLMVPVTFAVALLSTKNASGLSRLEEIRLSALIRPTIIFAALLVTGIGHLLDLPPPVVIGSAIIALILLSQGCFRVYRLVIANGWSSSFPNFVLQIALPLLAAALLLNLKRGPWLGVSMALLFVLWRVRRVLVIPFILLVAITALGIPGIRDRLDQSRQHFFITGGRSTIWKIGADLSTQYPLGIGVGNSPILRQFAPDVPPELKHFHCNLLNVVVENGWPAAGILLTWLGILVGPLLWNRTKESLAAIGFRSALISWQIAGIVEFNMGDSEVVIIAFLIISMLIHLRTESISLGTTGLVSSWWKTPP